MIQKHIPMGVINITPNSFSDGGVFLDATNIQELINKFNESSRPYCLDFGAESSAPFNDAISDLEEWQRVEKYFLPLLKEGMIPKQTILSFDTYHIQTITKLMEMNELKEYEIIWNDISGQVDVEMLEILKAHPSLNYVLCHNLCPSRDRANFHMEYLDDSLNGKSLAMFFEKRLSKLKDNGVDLDRIILDPCFGFSKTKEQNYLLLRQANEYIDLHDRWVLGVSKKSFLQAMCPGETKELRREQSESFHMLILSQWMKSYQEKNIFFRIHNPEIFNQAQKSLILL
jgi:dihydropteroate synthase